MKSPYTPKHAPRREYALVVGGAPIASSNFDSPPQIQATISNTYGSALSIANIKIFNLSQSTAENLIALKAPIILSAGNNGMMYPLFTGFVVNGFRYTTTLVDNVTELYCRSTPSKPPIKFAQSFPMGTPISSVIQAVAAIIPAVASIPPTFQKALTRPQAVKGIPSAILSSLGKQYDFTYKVDLGRLSIYPNNAPPMGTPTIILSKDMFLNGSTLTDKGCTVRCNLRNIRPFDLVALKVDHMRYTGNRGYFSEFNPTLRSGVYKVISVVHMLDFYSGDWCTEFDAISI